MKKWFLIAFLSSIGVANAQEGQNCAARDEVISVLQQRYGESLSVSLLTESGNVMELYVNEVKPSWTLTVLYPNGLMCAVGAGSAVMVLPNL